MHRPGLPYQLKHLNTKVTLSTPVVHIPVFANTLHDELDLTYLPDTAATWNNHKDFATILKERQQSGLPLVLTFHLPVWFLHNWSLFLFQTSKFSSHLVRIHDRELHGAPRRQNEKVGQLFLSKMCLSCSIGYLCTFQPSISHMVIWWTRHFT